MMSCVALISVGIRGWAVLKDGPDTDILTLGFTLVVLLHEQTFMCFFGLLMSAFYQDPEIATLLSALLVPTAAWTSRVSKLVNAYTGLVATQVYSWVRSPLRRINRLLMRCPFRRLPTHASRLTAFSPAFPLRTAVRVRVRSGAGYWGAPEGRR